MPLGYGMRLDPSGDLKEERHEVLWPVHSQLTRRILVLVIPTSRQRSSAVARLQNPSAEPIVRLLAAPRLQLRLPGPSGDLQGIQSVINTPCILKRPVQRSTDCSNSPHRFSPCSKMTHSVKRSWIVRQRDSISKFSIWGWRFFLTACTIVVVGVVLHVYVPTRNDPRYAPKSDFGLVPVNSFVSHTQTGVEYDFPTPNRNIKY